MPLAKSLSGFVGKDEPCIEPNLCVSGRQGRAFVRVLLARNSSTIALSGERELPFWIATRADRPIGSWAAQMPRGSETTGSAASLDAGHPHLPASIPYKCCVGSIPGKVQSASPITEPAHPGDATDATSGRRAHRPRNG